MSIFEVLDINVPLFKLLSWLCFGRQWVCDGVWCVRYNIIITEMIYENVYITCPSSSDIASIACSFSWLSSSAFTDDV